MRVIVMAKHMQQAVSVYVCLYSSMTALLLGLVGVHSISTCLSITCVPIDHVAFHATSLLRPLI